jgi:hypothetical protein
MELVEKTQHWIEGIDHCVSFDSWDQFINYGHGLRSNWSHLSLLSWGCKQNQHIYDLQIVYIQLNENPTSSGKKLPIMKYHRFELKCVTARVKETDVPAIKAWLVENDSDLWGMKALTGTNADQIA